MTKQQKLGLAAIAVVVVVGGIFGYKAYSQSSFKHTAEKLTEQKSQAAEQYSKIGALVSDLGNMLSKASDSGDPTDLQPADVDKKISELKQEVDAACAAKGSDITSANVESKGKGLWISADQKKYLSDSKAVLASLEKSQLSNTGACSQGKLVIGALGGTIHMSYGYLVLLRVQLGSDPSSLKALKDFKADDPLLADADVQKNLPKTVAYVKNKRAYVVTVYKAAEARAKGDQQAAAQYTADLARLDADDSALSSASDKELSALSDQNDTAAATAGTQELAAISYQKEHKTSIADKLDNALPALWLLDTRLNEFNDKTTIYPRSSNLGGLLNALNDQDLDRLDKQGLLKNITYTGGGQTYELKVPLLSGKTLTFKP